MAEKEYRKLAGRGKRKGELFTWNTLWQGRDHILQVEHTGYSEEYKRFYFADIQSISVFKTNRAFNWMIFFLAMMAGGATLGATFGSGGTDVANIWFYGSGGIVALSALLLIVNAVKGPGCSCFIQTAVHREQLPSLKRVKKAHKVIARLREQIGAAQGLLAPEEARARFVAGENPTGPDEAQAIAPPPPSPERIEPPAAS